MSQNLVSTKGKRTNSLAFSMTDCHTCASLGQRCDRRRPQCSTCLGQGRRCGGFATPLSWDTRRIWTENPTGTVSNVSTQPTFDEEAPTSATCPNAASKPLGQSRSFQFVMGASKPRKRRRISLFPSENSGRIPLSVRPAVQDNRTATECPARPMTEVEETASVDVDRASNCIGGLGTHYPYPPPIKPESAIPSHISKTRFLQMKPMYWILSHPILSIHYHFRTPCNKTHHL